MNGPCNRREGGASMGCDSAHAGTSAGASSTASASFDSTRERGTRTHDTRMTNHGTSDHGTAAGRHDLVLRRRCRSRDHGDPEREHEHEHEPEPEPEPEFTGHRFGYYDTAHGNRGCVRGGVGATPGLLRHGRQAPATAQAADRRAECGRDQYATGCSAETDPEPAKQRASPDGVDDDREAHRAVCEPGQHRTQGGQGAHRPDRRLLRRQGVDVLDSDGKSVVSPDRPDTGWVRYLVANYKWKAAPRGGWRIASGTDLKRAPCAAS